MDNFLDIGIVRMILAIVIGVLVLGLFGWFKFRRDEKIVADFLKTSGVSPDDAFKTTGAISSATHLSENRIRVICGKSTRFRRHREDKESWKLSD